MLKRALKRKFQNSYNKLLIDGLYILPLTSLLAKCTNMKTVYKYGLLSPVFTEKSYTFPPMIFQNLTFHEGNSYFNFLLKS